MTDYSPAMLRAFERTVQAYEQAILDLEENGVNPFKVRERWYGYTSVDHCLLCKACDTNCRLCIIDECNTQTRDRLWGAIVYYDVDKLLPALKARLAWIIKKAEANGVVLEEAE